MELLLPILLFAGMYFLLIRPQQRRVKEQQAMVASAKAGDRVLMTSGIYGTITEVLQTSAYVELADGFEVLITRQGIQEIVEEFPLDEPGAEDMQDEVSNDMDDDDMDEIDDTYDDEIEIEDSEEAEA